MSSTSPRRWSRFVTKYICCLLLSGFCSVAVAAENKPRLRFELVVEAAPEDFRKPRGTAYHTAKGGRVVWVPDMPLAGYIRVFNRGSDDYVVRSETEDFLKKVSFVGAMVNRKTIFSRDLPPVVFSYSTTTKKILLTPGGPGVLVKFQFKPGPGFVWPTGRWEPVFQINIGGGRKPVRVSTRVRLKKVETPDDRLNVHWFHYQRTYNDGKYDTALQSLDKLIRACPNDAFLKHKRYQLLFATGSLEAAAASLRETVALVESGKTTRPLVILRARSQEESLAILKKQQKGMDALAKQGSALDAVGEGANRKQRDTAAAGLKSHCPVIQVKALRALIRASAKETVESVVPLLSASDSANYYAPDGSLILVRREAWDTICKLHPRLKKAAYDPQAHEESREKAIVRLRALMQPRQDDKTKPSSATLPVTMIAASLLAGLILVLLIFLGMRSRHRRRTVNGE